MHKSKSSTARQQISRVLNTVASVHGVEALDMLNKSDRAAPKEIQRAKNHLRYVVSEMLGVREAARVLECAPASIVYARKAYRKLYKKDFYYTELLNEVIKKI